MFHVEPLSLDERDNLLRLRDIIGEYLTTMGGKITDFGYDATSGTAELVVQSPSGPRLEVTIRVLP